MRLGDLDQMAIDESEAYMSAQIKIESPVTLGLNSVVHMKIQQLIADTPTIDAVPVVRCRECMMHGNCTTEDVFNCSGMDMAEAFCCVGKRKDGAEAVEAWNRRAVEEEQDG